MCGRYALFYAPHLSSRFGVENDFDVDPDYNIAPGGSAPVVIRNSPNQARLMKWGLIPGWSKTFKMTLSTFNARLDKLLTSRLYKPLLSKRRCIIPANGFYEWTHENGKIPHYIHLNDQEVFGFAGLYDIWSDAEEHEFYSFTIITTEANVMMKPIHNRMPVILFREDEDKWLDHERVKPEEALTLLKQYKAMKMGEYEVSTDVNSSRTNSPDLVKPVV
jgi:putative SOS response-associated peptidase YedK